MLNPFAFVTSGAVIAAVAACMVIALLLVIVDKGNP